LVTLERSTLATYIGYADKHIRPLIGQVQVGALDADVFDSFYAELRRCREHCTGARFVEHRTPAAHECDPRCRPHTCRPLGASTIRQIHFILSGALKRAVRWRWIATNPIARAEPPAAPKPNPRRPTAQLPCLDAGAFVDGQFDDGERPSRMFRDEVLVDLVEHARPPPGRRGELWPNENPTGLSSSRATTGRNVGCRTR
jgi:hypothetical protein